ncbi:MAG TPA: M1 family aminopeptidase [Acidobacteriaceae bacterium]|nr:M1 family aminopeptidase [Acidobacteriaceae bacterium]
MAVQEFQMQRDAAVFTFHSGSFSLYGAVNGRITGAVFRGQGSLHLVPPDDQEKHSLSLLTKAPVLDETFDSAVFRFTDDTAAEIRKAATASASSDSSLTSLGQQFANTLRTRLHWNLDARLLEDVLSSAPGGFFLASIDGKKFASKMIFILDPRGARDVQPEEVELMTWNDNRNGVWTAFRSQDFRNQDRAQGSANEANTPYTIDRQDLETTIAKNGMLTGLARTTVHAHTAGLAVVPLELFPTLRVSSVKAADGTPLSFIQEGKDNDPDFAVILPGPAKADDRIELQIAYAGKEVVINEGGDNYYLEGGARERWYPSARQGGLSGYSTYHMTFHVPKGLGLIATGKPIRQSTEGSATTSEWSSDIPIPVVGSNLGQFTKATATLKSGFVIGAYANSSLPDSATSIQRLASAADSDMAVGTLSTTAMLKPALSEGQVAIEIYSRFFGPLQFGNLALTQQTACNYGQSWPMLVYLPICAFWDTTVQHQLGLDRDPMYWKVVTPHEVAHQWWGQTVSFRSYRDQWMSEGFADFSASIFLQDTNKTNNEYREFWRQQRERIVGKNAQGFRPIDVGPVTMGYRLANSRSGEEVYRDLVYPKGAYILHMIRMMTWNSHTGDQWLMETLQDFVHTYRGQPASTEDFKAILEKHMTPGMDLDRNRKLDWFFNEYVYGTALPHYSFASTIRSDEKGTIAHVRLIQSNVDSTFKMLVPIYAELADGRTVHLGTTVMIGNSTEEQDVSLGHPPVAIRRLLLDYNYDVLSTQN